MPVTRMPDGTMKFDTVEEAVAYDRLTERAVRAPATSPGSKGASSRGESDVWTALMLELRGEQQRNQRDILGWIKAAGESGIARADLAEKLGTNEQGVGGAVAGITKACKRAGLDSLVQLVESEGGVYSAGPLLRSHELPKETSKMTK